MPGSRRRDRAPDSVEQALPPPPAPLEPPCLPLAGSAAVRRRLLLTLLFLGLSGSRAHGICVAMPPMAWRCSPDEHEPTAIATWKSFCHRWPVLMGPNASPMPSRAGLPTSGTQQRKQEQLNIPSTAGNTSRSFRIPTSRRTFPLPFAHLVRCARIIAGAVKIGSPAMPGRGQPSSAFPLLAFPHASPTTNTDSQSVVERMVASLVSIPSPNLFFNKLQPILQHINRTATCVWKLLPRCSCLFRAPFTALGTSPRPERQQRDRTWRRAQRGQRCSSATRSRFTPWGIATSSVPA
jgi:hypothetical protein